MAAGNVVLERMVMCDSFAVEQDFSLQHNPSYMHVCCVGDVTGAQLVGLVHDRLQHIG